VAKPFIRCVGGKRQLAAAIFDLLPREFNTYFEPFLGGGAVFYTLRAQGRVRDQHITLGDYDFDLVDLYKAVRDDAEGLHKSASAIAKQMMLHVTSDAQKNFYLAMRAAWNAGARSPALNLFLRSTTFNGVWRVSKKGNMNVSWRKTAPRLPLLNELIEAQVALQTTDLTSGSYDTIMPKRDDFVYMDPPYYGGFVAYTQAGWTLEDAVKHLQTCARWARDGVKIMVSHSDTEEFRFLLRDHWPEAKLHVVQARRAVNRDGAGRGPVGELILTSY